MAIIVDHESDYKGEQKVRNAIANFLSDDVVVYNKKAVTSIPLQSFNISCRVYNSDGY